MFRRQFGKAPSGNRLATIMQSPHYRDGRFQNIHETPTLTQGYSMTAVLYNFLFRKHPNARPVDNILGIPTNLKSLSPTEDVLIWFGHSSYFIQLCGKRILVDPVFSGNASPIPYSNRSFKGTDLFQADDMPVIDYLIITHDHYDHLDYKSILALQSGTRQFICGLGVGAHLEYWRISAQRITELDWDENMDLGGDLQLYSAPSRHFSGRGFRRNNTLWLSFILEAPGLRLYLGGDSGYDTHFGQIGNQFQEFDLALLDNGQYNLAWQAIHMLPAETLKAASDLKTKRLFPVHNSKFKLASHPWKEPLKTITELNAQGLCLPLVTPMIGEIVYLRNPDQTFSRWWESVR